MSCALVGDVAHVVGIETLRSTPLVVHGSGEAPRSLGRTLRPHPRLVESARAEILRNAAHLCVPPLGLRRGAVTPRRASSSEAAHDRAPHGGAHARISLESC